MRGYLFSSTAKTIVGASALATLGAFPVFLLGADSVTIRADLRFDEFKFGVAVSAFFAAAALTSVSGGRAAERCGLGWGTSIAGALCILGNTNIAWLAGSWAAILFSMIILGVAHALCQLISNLAIATAIPQRRRGLGFGIKQSAVPIAILFAGITVPVISSNLGWRFPFLISALAGLGGMVVGMFIGTKRYVKPHSSISIDRPPVGALLITMVAFCLASAAVNSLGSYTASWGFEVGLTTWQAGMLLAAGSACNVAVRLLDGHLADRRQGGNLPVVAFQIMIGGVALGMLSVSIPSVMVISTIIAFGIGWSWTGLLIFAVARIGRDAPASASGVVQAGAFIGGAAGPLLFGFSVTTVGYSIAWVGAAVVMLIGGLLILIARRLFITDIRVRPPRAGIDD